MVNTNRNNKMRIRTEACSLYSYPHLIVSICIYFLDSCKMRELVLGAFTVNKFMMYERFVCLFDLILYVHSTIFQLCGTVLPGFNQC